MAKKFDIKMKIDRLAKREGRNVSQSVHELLENSIQTQDVSSYINDLWDRITTKLSPQHASSLEISRIIKSVRKART